jgi:hypothetical protein
MYESKKNPEISKFQAEAGFLLACFSAVNMETTRSSETSAYVTQGVATEVVGKGKVVPVLN